MSLGPVVASRFEKAAIDNGFDLSLPAPEDWAGYGSTQAKLRLWLTITAESTFVAALSQHKVAHALVEEGGASSTMIGALPDAAVAAVSVIDFASLHKLVRRAFQLSRTLPDEILHVVEHEVASLSKTEVERVVLQRVGQRVYRERLLEYWNGRCAITGLAVPALLRASHIKAWAKCETNAERLDVFNGLLLAPNFDAAFDVGLITVLDDGCIEISSGLSFEARAALGLAGHLSVAGLTDGHRKYLAWHRSMHFKT
jgi:putative restriction endonuclease